MNIQGKVLVALALIDGALGDEDKAVVAFSGGKDSVVVLDLVRQVRPGIEAVFCNTKVEYPDTVRFCRSIPNLVELLPEKSFWRCVDDYGWPKMKSKGTTHGNRCCLYLKERPALKYYKENEVDLIFTGLTADESRNRWMFFKRLGPHYFMKTWGVWKCHPIWNWSVEEVWAYIRQKKIPYNPIYDKGAVRCGCGPCTAYLSWKKRLAKENPKLLRIILKKQRQERLVFDCKGELKV